MAQEHSAPSTPWYRDLTPYHWFVFAVASLAWLFDCLDQQLFILARNKAMESLIPAGMDPKLYGGYATSIFVAGWALGGLIFGSLGDRFGRAKMLTITVLIYSICTGLSAFSKGWIDFAAYRFLTGLGVGGVFGLAVALVADTLPDRSRTGALGMLQALSAVGNVAAGLISMYIGSLEAGGSIVKGSGWKYMFLVGAIPAFLCVFIQLRLKEPEKWVQARAAGKAAGVKFGSYASLLGDVRWRGPALLGMVLCVAGVIGLWGIGFFSPELVGDVIKASLVKEGVPEAEIAGKQQYWIGVNSIVQNLGAFVGMLAFTRLAQGIGRRAAFAIGYVAALVVTVAYFQLFNGRGDIWMSAVMGGCQLALFAGFAIYLPELFPTSLRSTGTSFCYNVGRFVAATGPFTLGALQAALKAGATTPEAKLAAFRNACSYMSVIFLLGLVALAFLPETKGRPLPEEPPPTGGRPSRASRLGPAWAKPRFALPGWPPSWRPHAKHRHAAATDGMRVGHELSSGLPVPREPACEFSASQDGEAEKSPSERSPGWAERASGDGARAAPSLRASRPIVRIAHAMAASWPRGRRPHPEPEALSVVESGEPPRDGRPPEERPRPCVGKDVGRARTWKTAAVRGSRP